MPEDAPSANDSGWTENERRWNELHVSRAQEQEEDPIGEVEPTAALGHDDRSSPEAVSACGTVSDPSPCFTQQQCFSDRDAHVPCDRFHGPVPGYVFKTSHLGLGYHLESSLMQAMADVERVLEEKGEEVLEAAIVARGLLSLSDLGRMACVG